MKSGCLRAASSKVLRSAEPSLLGISLLSCLADILGIFKSMANFYGGLAIASLYTAAEFSRVKGWGRCNSGIVSMNSPLFT